MGLFDFVRNAGTAVGGAVKAAQAAVKGPADGKVQGASMSGSMDDGHAAPPPPASDIAKIIKNLDIDLKGLEVTVEGERVVLKGDAPTTEVKEKAILAAGNVLGVSQVEEHIAVSKPEPASHFYTVKKGDTLWKIAEAEYGKGKGAKYTVIFNANKPMLKDPDEIYPGQVLRVPPLESQA